MKTRFALLLLVLLSTICSAEPELTPFEKAFNRSDFATMKAMIKREPGLVDMELDSGFRPLSSVLHSDDLSRIKFLIKHGANVHFLDSLGQSALARAESIGAAEMMVAAGCKVEYVDRQGNSMLHGVASAELVPWYIAKGLSIDGKTDDGDTPLHLAGSLEVIRALLKHGADLEMKNEGGKTPLLDSINGSYPEHALFYIEKEANIQARDDEGLTLLHIAANEGSVELVNMALSQKMDPNVLDEELRNALHSAAAGTDNGEVVGLLIQAGTDFNKADRYGSTPLHIAASSRNSQVATALLKAGADFNKLDSRDRTPLHNAARGKRVFPKRIDETAVAKALLLAGADIAKRDAFGKTPVDYAILVRNWDFLELLQTLDRD